MNIKKRREELDLTQTDLAIKCGVSLVTIRLWELGASTPKAKNLKKLRAALKLQLPEDSDS